MPAIQPASLVAHDEQSLGRPPRPARFATFLDGDIVSGAGAAAAAAPDRPSSPAARGHGRRACAPPRTSSLHRVLAAFSNATAARQAAQPLPGSRRSWRRSMGGPARRAWRQFPPPGSCRCRWSPTAPQPQMRRLAPARRCLPPTGHARSAPKHWRARAPRRNRAGRPPARGRGGYPFSPFGAEELDGEFRRRGAG